MYRIVDLDNCISNDGWRVSKIRWDTTDIFERYHAYHLLAPYDEFGNRDLVQTSDDVIIMTARPLHYHGITEAWLNRHEVKCNILIMRNDNDIRRAQEVKATQLDWLFNLYNVAKEQIRSAFDDRFEVVEMYRSHGINAEVRSLHNFSAYEPIKQ